MGSLERREAPQRHPDRDPDEYYFAAELKDIWLRIWRYYEWYTRMSLTKYGTRVRWTVLAEQMTNVAVWLLVHAVLISQGLGVKVLFIFWLPIAFVALVINPITRGYEHAPITLYPPNDPRRRDMSKNAITVNNPVLGWVCANITFHVEHHSTPRCPFYNLQKLHRLFQEERMQYLVAPFPLYRVGFGGRQPFNMMRDWTQEALTGTYRVKGDAADYDHELEQLTVPVLMVSLQGDTLVPRPSADYLARKLTRAQVAQIELRAEDGTAYHHFRWVKKPAAILAQVDQWIGAQFSLAQRGGLP